VGWTILFSLWAVRYDFKWHSLGEWYRTTAKVADVDLPVLIRLLWPIAPAAWWGWLSPVTFGVFAAYSVRYPWRLSGQLTALFGAVLLAGVVWSTVVTYTRMTFYMGVPPPEPIEASSLVGNTALLLVGLVLAAWSIQRNKNAEQASSSNGG
jgi:hypothetical protein